MRCDRSASWVTLLAGLIFGCGLALTGCSDDSGGTPAEDAAGDAAKQQKDARGGADTGRLADALAGDGSGATTGDGASKCGGDGQPCCNDASPCGSGLICCTGVPYPQGGACHPKCDLKSDRNAKRDLRSVDGAELLRRLSRLPVSSWRYVGEPKSVRHIGPMAQDFRRAFGFGRSEKLIDMVDASGVAIAAIKQLAARVDALDAQLRALRADRARLLRRARRCAAHPR